MSAPYRELFIFSHIPPREIASFVQAVAGPEPDTGRCRNYFEIAKRLMNSTEYIDQVSFINDAMLRGWTLTLCRGESKVSHCFSEQELHLSIIVQETICRKFFELEWRLFSDEEKFAMSIGRFIFLAARIGR